MAGDLTGLGSFFFGLCYGFTTYIFIFSIIFLYSAISFDVYWGNRVQPDYQIAKVTGGDLCNFIGFFSSVLLTI